MKNSIKTTILAICFLILTVPSLVADVSVSQLFSNGVVLQREMPVPIWGWAAPGENVKVSFAGQTKTATADQMGRWQIILDSMPANDKGQSLTVTGKSNKLEIKDVLVGEVWLMVGDHIIKNRFQKTGNAGKADNQLRLAYLMREANCRYPQDKPDITKWMSKRVPQGPPVFFGRDLQTDLKIPVGIIVSSSSGTITPFFSLYGMDGIPELDYLKPLVADADPRTPSGKTGYENYKKEVEAWLTNARECLKQKQPLPAPPTPPQTDYPAFDKGNSGEWNVGSFYNSLIHPLVPMAFRGVVMHAGTYNARFGASGGYDHRIAFGAKSKAVLQTFRQTFNKPNLPVCFLGVSNGDKIFEALRIDQENSLKNIKNCDVVPFYDLGSNEQNAAKRLACFILKKYYNITPSTDAREFREKKPSSPPVDPSKGTGFDPKVFSVPGKTNDTEKAPNVNSLRLPAILSSNMVLQRNVELPIWGRGKPGSQVTVAFAGQKAKSTVDKSGRWQVKLPAMKMNKKGQQMVIESGSEKLTLDNILIGDVWLCSGQSNMAMQVGSCLDLKNEKATANHPEIRHIGIKSVFSPVPQADTELQKKNVAWQECKPETVAGFSAAAYFFAKEVNQKTGVPIGLINSSLGGSMIEPWICPEGYYGTPELAEITANISTFDPNSTQYQNAQDQVFKQIEGWLKTFDQYVAKGERPPALPALVRPPRSTTIAFQDSRGCQLYNGQIYGLLPFPIKGALWYQGESNGGESDTYFHKMKGLINGWRKVWNQGEFPFYFVQLANYQAPSKSPAQGDGWAKLREAQVKSLSIPNTGMAVIIDIGEARDIHPKNKQDVGKRLARWALYNDYGMKDLVPSGPLYDSFSIEGNTIRIKFKYADNGLIVGKKEGLKPIQALKDGKLAEFAIMGQDQKWVDANATIDGNTVVVSSPNVKKPVAVRYAFCQNPSKANLYNKEGLPASPFRTDK